MKVVWQKVFDNKTMLVFFSYNKIDLKDLPNKSLSACLLPKSTLNKIQI